MAFGMSEREPSRSNAGTGQEGAPGGTGLSGGASGENPKTCDSCFFILAICLCWWHRCWLCGTNGEPITAGK